MNWQNNSWGPPPNWGGPPNVVYVPVPNPVKEGDDPFTQVIKQQEMADRLKRLFKEEKKDGEKKDAKGLSIREMCWVMALLSLPIGWLTSFMFLVMVKGIQNNIHELLLPH